MTKGTQTHEGRGDMTRRWCVLGALMLAVLAARGQPSNVVVWGGVSPMLPAPEAASNVVRLSVGASFIANQEQALAVRSDGRVVRWGAGAPSVPDHLTNLVSASVGRSYHIGLRADGLPQIWATLSHPTNTPLAATNLISVHVGTVYDAGLRADGAPVFWGNVIPVVGVPPPQATDLIRLSLARISSGASPPSQHVLGLRRDGMPIAWGAPAQSMIHPPLLLPEANGVDVARGGYFDLALLGDGTLRAWGDGTYGLTNPPAAATNIVAIAAGLTHALALRNDGTVFAWGNHSYGQANVPAGLSNVIAIAAGQAANAAATGDGSPRFVDQMGRVEAVRRSDFALNAFAVGAPPLGYQWFKKDTLLEGKNEPVLKLPLIEPALAGDYRVVVSNSLGCVTGLVASVTVVEGAGLTGPNVIVWGPDNPPPPPVIATGIVQLVSQVSQNIGRRENGTLLAWGTSSAVVSNALVQAGGGFVGFAGSLSALVGWRGDGRPVSLTPQNEWTTLIPEAATNVVDVATLNVQILGALRDDGEVVTWGAVSPRPRPAEFARLRRLTGGKSNGANASMFLGLRQDGRPIPWMVTESPLPDLPDPSGANIVAAAVGADNVAYLTGDGRVRSNIAQSAPEIASNIVAVTVVSLETIMALRNDGRVFAWGGSLPTTHSFTNPPASFSRVIALGPGTHQASVAFGDGHLRFVDRMGDSVAILGRDFSLNAFAVGDAPISYEWRKNGVPINGEAAPTLRLETVTAADEGVYSVWVSNRWGTAVSEVARISVEQPPVIAPDPLSLSVRAGLPAAFGAGASGEPPLAAQWQRDGVDLPGATNFTFTLPVARPEDAGDYRIIVRNFTGFATSQVAVLTVLPGIGFQIPDEGGGFGPEGFRLRVTGLEPNGPVILYGSTNLTDWLPLRTNPPTSGVLDFLDADPVGRAHRFYKVEEAATP